MGLMKESWNITGRLFLIPPNFLLQSSTRVNWTNSASSSWGTQTGRHRVVRCTQLPWSSWRLRSQLPWCSWRARSQLPWSSWRLRSQLPWCSCRWGRLRVFFFWKRPMLPNERSSGGEVLMNWQFSQNRYTWNLFVLYFGAEKPSKRRLFPIKTGVIWGPGIYIFFNYMENLWTAYL